MPNLLAAHEVPVPASRSAFSLITGARGVLDLRAPAAVLVTVDTGFSREIPTPRTGCSTSLATPFSTR